MRPLPNKANTIFELAFYDYNIKKAEEIFNFIQDPLDKSFSRFFLTSFYSITGDRRALKSYVKQLETIREKNPNPLVNFINKITYHYCLGHINLGINIPIENYAEGKKNLVIIQEFIKQNEDFIKNYDPWIYHYFQLRRLDMGMFILNDYDDRIRSLQECINETKMIPIDTKQLMWYYTCALGVQLVNTGKFDEARKMFDITPKKTNDLILMLTYYEKARLSYIKGNLSEAINIALIGLQNIENKDFTYGIVLIKTSLAFYYQEKGEIEKAKKILKECIDLNKILSDPFATILGYYHMIRLLTNNYQISYDPSLLSEAKIYLTEASEFALDQTDNLNAKNYIQISKAIILKFGRFSEKAQAYQILKNMKNYYSRNQISIQLKLDLIELLLEEAKAMSTDKNVMKEIILELDTLINQIATKGILYTRNGSILKYIRHQILVSRYYFYIKGQSHEAIENLQAGLKQIDNYDLPEIKKKLQLEIDKMTNQIMFYTNQSIPERLKQVEIEKYFKQAIQIKELAENSGNVE